MTVYRKNPKKIRFHGVSVNIYRHLNFFTFDKSTLFKQKCLFFAVKRVISVKNGYFDKKNQNIFH